MTPLEAASKTPEFHAPSAIGGPAIGAFIGDTVMAAFTGHDILGWMTGLGPDAYKLQYVAPRDIAFGALTGLVRYGIHRYATRG